MTDLIAKGRHLASHLYGLDSGSGDARVIAGLCDEVERLQETIDSRPAINAGLPETYIKWSQSIYEMEAARARGIADN